MFMEQLLLATSNPGKRTEFAAALLSIVRLVHMLPRGVELPEETGETFLENALLKARSACAQTGMVTLADDSGLVVHALGGAPGIFSARYAGPGATEEENRRRLLQDLQDVPNKARQAQFCAALAVAFPDGREVTATGSCAGEIAWEPSGRQGFGYDSLFYYPPLGCTFAELSAAEKNKISHRAGALSMLLKKLQ